VWAHGISLPHHVCQGSVMGNVDLPLDELRNFRPVLTTPPDLADFWERTFAETRRHPIAAEFRPYDTGLRTVDVFDVSFAGYDGQRVAAWLILPRAAVGPLPCVIEYVGYGGGRGLPHEWLGWSAFGYAHLVMDTRGQGSAWRSGVTPDLSPSGADPHAPGFLTLGLPDRDRYYYRRLIMDACRAVDAAREHPGVDNERVILHGHSQGGALTVAASVLRGWLLDDPVAGALSDEPFLAHFRRAAEIADNGPYPELVTWCSTHRDRAEAAFEMLAYFDIAVLAPYGVVPALFSVSLRDDICPPSTVFTAYNRYGENANADKDIRVWEWNEHKGGEAFHRLEQLSWLTSRAVGPPAGA